MNCLNYRQDIVNRFWKKVNIPNDYVNECWEHITDNYSDLQQLYIKVKR